MIYKGIEYKKLNNRYVISKHSDFVKLGYPKNHKGYVSMRKLEESIDNRLPPEPIIPEMEAPKLPDPVNEIDIRMKNEREHELQFCGILESDYFFSVYPIWEQDDFDEYNEAIVLGIEDCVYLDIF